MPKSAALKLAQRSSSSSSSSRSTSTSSETPTEPHKTSKKPAPEVTDKTGSVATRPEQKTSEKSLAEPSISPRKPPEARKYKPGPRSVKTVSAVAFSGVSACSNGPDDKDEGLKRKSEAQEGQNDSAKKPRMTGVVVNDTEQPTPSVKPSTKLRVCDQCDATFPDIASLMDHLINVHPEPF